MTRLGELAGRLTERIGIERREPARDAGGGAIGEWREVAQAWAALEPVGRVPMVQGDALRGRLIWAVTVRGGTDVAIDDRVRWRDAVLRVRRVTRDPREPDRIHVDTEEEA